MMEREGEIKNDKQVQAFFCQIMKDLLESYDNLQAFCQSKQVVALPDFALVIAEAQALRVQWQSDEPSYTRDYLNAFWKENERTQGPNPYRIAFGPDPGSLRIFPGGLPSPGRNSALSP